MISAVYLNTELSEIHNTKRLVSYSSKSLSTSSFDCWAHY